MAFSTPLGAAAHDGRIELIEPRDQPDMVALVGWNSSKKASIQHFFPLSVFHFAPISLNAR